MTTWRHILTPARYLITRPCVGDLSGLDLLAIAALCALAFFADRYVSEWGMR